MTSPKLIKAVMDWYEQGKNVFVYGKLAQLDDFLSLAAHNTLKDGDVYATPSTNHNDRIDTLEKEVKALWDSVDQLEEKIRNLK